MATDVEPVEEQDDYVAEPALKLGRRRGGEDVEMDITPMIDVTFLLLIFFLNFSHTLTYITIILIFSRRADIICEKK